ncbi:MAG: hypothetical protein GIX03_12545 [Candidatus Eremiobacteraeota bacterium]|nr:hypothetical protein [Candidatus Eremiobacteraeota bacterium]MBC5803794.1 hypothetical protein [Candidatus Eremiobacteraeota bacterium]MBC5825849.1 hypothetical protein [Candidatus Eremiobacteraeota bacterium]
MVPGTMDNDETQMRPYYDFSGGRRGRYAERYAQGTNLARLDPDVAEKFPDGEAVNTALRKLAETRSVTGS